MKQLECFQISVASTLTDQAHLSGRRAAHAPGIQQEACSSRRPEQAHPCLPSRLSSFQNQFDATKRQEERWEHAEFLIEPDRLGNIPRGYGNGVVATLPYYNTPTGKQTGNIYVFYTDVTLQAGKTVQSVTLPPYGSNGPLHVFAIGTK